MIELSGLRRYENQNGVARLEADIKFIDMESEIPDSTMYFEIDVNYIGMLVDDTYDPFVLIALYLAMKNNTDLRVRGNVSKRLYKNLMWYGQKIMCDFSNKLSPVDIIVDGFTIAQPTGILIGTGVSCGVDSLTTIYDRFVCEDDPDYKVNTLFFFNCGTNGNVTASFTMSFAQARSQRSTALASELGLSFVPMNTNLHSFWGDKPDQTIIYLAIYSCALALQNALRRYYVSSTFSYNNVKNSTKDHANFDFAEFCESYFVPLVSTERTELIIDGCQYRRVDKIKKLVDWDIARRYLNVCRIYSVDSHNCGVCAKCLRTLLPLEILGKLDDFASIFVVEKYRERSMWYKAECVAQADKNLFYKEILDFAAENNFTMPIRRDCYTIGKQVVIFDDKK